MFKNLNTALTRDARPAGLEYLLNIFELSLKFQIHKPIFSAVKSGGHQTQDLGACIVGIRKCITIYQIRLFCVCERDMHTNIRFKIQILNKMFLWDGMDFPLI